jgi:acetyl esterase/lipase
VASRPSQHGGPRTIAYGPHNAQVADLWLPPGAGGALPVVALVHGGFWRAVFRRGLMTPLARAVTAAGFAAWNIEYRRVGFLGGGGGWPATPDDVDTALRHLATLPEVDPARVALCGHSAGGQLAFAALGSRLDELEVRGAVSLASVLDLDAGARLGLGGMAVQAFLGGEPDAVSERYERCSPARLLPLGVRQLVVHGDDDAVVPPSMSAGYVDRARRAGDDVTYLQLPATGHREVISPHGPAWEGIASFLGEVLAK